MISFEAIVTSVYRQATAELPEGLAIAWPGVQLDSEAIEEWVELWCDEINGIVQRDNPPERREVSLAVHMFVRPSAQTTRVHALAEAVKGAFSAQVLPVYEPGAEPETPVGLVRFREADVRDLTRLHADVERRPLRHVVVLVRGTAQALEV